MSEEVFKPKFKIGDWVEILYDYDKIYTNYKREYFGKISNVSFYKIMFPYELEGIFIPFMENELKLVE